MSTENNGLFERLVLAKLDLHDAKIEQLLVAVAGLKVKSGIWGAIAGLIPTSIALVYIIFRW